MTIHRETLPDGGWADLRDAADVPERLRRPVRTLQMLLAGDPAFGKVVADAKSKGVEAVRDGIDDAEALQMVEAMGRESFERMDELNDRAVIARVAGWSYSSEVTMDALLDLPGPVYDRLRELCADGALGDGAPSFEPSQDPASPTEPSTVSV